MEIILPLGISFYTFQTISYTVDVYRGFIKPEHNFIVYGCYVTFFPQLIAGPILRAKEVIHQLNTKRHHNWVDFGNGVRWILYGLFLKVVFADNLAPLVDSGFSQPLVTLSGLDAWTLAFLFGFQIYFDFSAYSHIAIGSARLMGLHFPDNFYYPYLANSPREFWRRWHISLSSWIRDYLYLPLTGANVQDRSTGGLAIVADQKKQQSQGYFLFILFITWAIMGLWHGANWTFLLWGLYHATLIAIYRFVSPLAAKWNKQLLKFLGPFITLPLIMLGWIPFRSESVSDALVMWGKLFFPSNYMWLGMRENNYLVAAVVLLAVLLTCFVRKAYATWVKRNSCYAFRLAIESVGFTIIIGLVFVFLRPIQQFIYFQF